MNTAKDRRYKSIVIVNAYGHSNRGDSVLLDECISEIRKSYPECNITTALFEGIDLAAQRDPSIVWTERIGNRRAGQSLPVTLWYIAIGILASIKPFAVFSKLLPYQQYKTLECIRKCDLLISAPGGYIHDTNAAFIVALCNLLIGINIGKLVVLAPQSIGPVKKPVLRAFTRFVLSRCHKICTREPYSYEFVTGDLRINSTQIIRVGDSAFWNSDVETEHSRIDAELMKLGLNKGEQFVGMTVVNWDFPHHRDPDLALQQYVKTMALLVDHIQHRHGLRCVIFNQVSDDIKIAEQIQRACSNVVFVDRGERNPRLLRGMISASAVFIGSRFHSCIFAISAHVPTFAIAYLPKTSHILNDIGLPKYSMPIDDLEIDVLLKEVDALLSGRRQRVEEIIAALTIYRNKYPVFAEVLTEIYQ
jgi:colanic acid/amylovoran biosynthesis protein